MKQVFLFLATSIIGFNMAHAGATMIKTSTVKVPINGAKQVRTMEEDAFEVEYRQFVRFTQSGGTYTKTDEKVAGWVTSWSKTATGVVSVDYSGMSFSYAPFCVCNVVSSGYTCNLTVTATTVTARLFATSVLLGVLNPADSNFSVYCAQGFN